MCLFLFCLIIIFCLFSFIKGKCSSFTIKTFLSRKKCINLWRYLTNHWQHLANPYLFQLWVAPRGGLIHFFRSDKIKSPSSPPGLEPGYAMFLYPDSLYFYWLISFSITVIAPAIFAIAVPVFFGEIPNIYIFYSVLFGLSFYIALYFFVYLLMRRPIFELRGNLLEILPLTKEVIPNITARISKRKWKIFICCSKRTSYLNRPIFFNPGKSLQEAILRIGMSSFVAANKEIAHGIVIIIFYFFSHIWTGFLYILFELIFILYTKEQKSTIGMVMQYMTIQTIFWLASASFFLIVHFFLTKNILPKNDIDNYMFNPSLLLWIKFYSKTTDEILKYLNPKLTFPILMALTFTILIGIINIILAANDLQGVI